PKQPTPPPPTTRHTRVVSPVPCHQLKCDSRHPRHPRHTYTQHLHPVRVLPSTPSLVEVRVACTRVEIVLMLIIDARPAPIVITDHYLLIPRDRPNSHQIYSKHRRCALIMVSLPESGLL